MPKTRIARSTIYARWLKAQESYEAYAEDGNRKGQYRACMRSAAAAFALAEFERDAHFRASWRKMANTSLKNASFYV